MQSPYRRENANIPAENRAACLFGHDLRHVGSDMIARMTSLRDLLERGYGMRAERLTEGLLIVASFLFDDLRPAYAAFGLLAAQAAVSPFLAPVALLWAAAWRRIPADRLGNLYYDTSGSRGAAAVACLVMLIAYALVRAGWPTVGRVLLAAPAASCILSPTVGFCAGCGYYVLGRDLLVRLGLVRGTPNGASDVDVEHQQ